MLTAAAPTPTPTARGRAPRPALPADSNAHAGRPWSTASRAAALADAQRWHVEFIRVPTCPACQSWPFAMAHACGGPTS